MTEKEINSLNGTNKEIWFWFPIRSQNIDQQKEAACIGPVMESDSDSQYGHRTYWKEASCMGPKKESDSDSGYGVKEYISQKKLPVWD